MRSKYDHGGSFIVRLLHLCYYSDAFPLHSGNLDCCSLAEVDPWRLMTNPGMKESGRLRRFYTTERQSAMETFRYRIKKRSNRTVKVADAPQSYFERIFNVVGMIV